MRFGGNSVGGTARIIVVIFNAVAPILGPFWLLAALLLPEKKICPKCLASVRMSESICPSCSALVPDEPRSMTADEVMLENHTVRFSVAIQNAIVRGQKDVSGISALIMFGILIPSIIASAFVLKGHPAAAWVAGLGLPLSLAGGWLWWSYKIPQWREWALRQPGVTADELQRAAEAAMLVWPKGHIFEKTEFRRRQSKH